jgi:hypothetical protein
LFRIGVQFRLYLLILCLAGTAASQPKRDLQTRVDSLVPGGTSLSQIQRLFGKPKSKQKVFEWWGGMRNGEFDGACRKSSLESENAGHDHVVKRTLLAFNYPELKVVFSVFDNPWQLYSVTIQNPSVSVIGRAGWEFSKQNREAAREGRVVVCGERRLLVADVSK